MECSDEELVARCLLDGSAAFEALFHRYERRVYNLAARSVGNPDDAEDIKQEVFYRAYKSLASFRGGCKFSTWLFRIAVNLCLDHAKKKKASTGIVDELMEVRTWEPWGQARDDDPEDALEKAEMIQALQKAILSIAPQYRILIVLRHIDGLSYEEIAAVLGCSVNSLNVRLHRARTALRNKMMPYFTAGREDKDHEMQTNKRKNRPAF